MAKNGDLITYESVAAAAMAIKDRNDGTKINVRTIRDELGGGSFTTLQAFLTRWKEGLPAQPRPPVEIPPIVLAGIRQAIEQASNSAQAELSAELAELRLSLEAITGEAKRTERALEQAEQTISEQESKQVDLSARLDEEKRTRLEAAAQAEERAKELQAEVARERASAESARTELAKAHLRMESVPRLESDLTASRTESSELRDRANAAERALAAVQAELAVLRESVERERQSASHAEARADADIAVARAACEKAENRADAERARYEAAAAELSALKVAMGGKTGP